MRFADADYPCEPYPGRRPEASFVHLDGVGHELVGVPRPRSPSGFVLAGDGVDLDYWLAEHDAAPVAGRIAVLAYGSNACPSKVTWLRKEHGLRGPAVVLTARCAGFAAVWATGFRQRDGVRPVTLTAMPGVVEEHAVWLATPAQVEALDSCEGADLASPRYRREVLPAAAVTVTGEVKPPSVEAYFGACADRRPMLIDGRMARATLTIAPPPPERGPLAARSLRLEDDETQS